MIKLVVKPLAVSGSSKEAAQRAGSRMKTWIDEEKFTIGTGEPDILYFLSGGTERMAVEHVSEKKFYILIGSKHNNAYASATEVKAFLNEMNIPSLLLDEEEEETSAIVQGLFAAKTAIEKLSGQRLGLIGQVSDWLISSETSSAVLRQKLGINLIQIPWETLAPFNEYKASEELLQSFDGNPDIELQKTGQVNELLKHAIHKNSLDAITVECFPMVQKDCVTACLPLALFNDKGFPAGCEGDLTAIAGMMLCKELTGTIPWIANINKATEEVCMFSHCTIAPGLVSAMNIQTHFETGVGTAIEGDFKGDLVTIFRFDRHLQKAFIAATTITGRPRSTTACRTQIEVKLSQKEVHLLRTKPLGNHHLVFPGDIKKLLEMVCCILDIEILNKLEHGKY